MKTAVVFYSLDGNCSLVAEEIKSHLKADLLRLRLTKEKKRGFVGSLFWGVGMVLFNKKPKLASYEFNASNYDLIILGAPVWADSPAPPINTFISQANITGKKIALFVCHAGGRGQSLEKFKTLLAGNEIIAEADYKDAVKNIEEAKQKIADFAKSLK
ncbi:MAG: flavodoxin [Treponema sp.]|jgi:flavodoxin|nr:flavodoxin [Treponema sp.]